MNSMSVLTLIARKCLACTFPSTKISCIFRIENVFNSVSEKAHALTFNQFHLTAVFEISKVLFNLRKTCPAFTLKENTITRHHFKLQSSKKSYITEQRK